LPADFGVGPWATQLDLTAAIRGAQGAFDLSVLRPDLDGFGLPWGSGQQAGPGGIGGGQAAQGGGFANARNARTAWDGLWDNVFGGGNGGGGGGGGGSANSRGVSVPVRVVDYPSCTPLTIAARTQAPTQSAQCYTLKVGTLATAPQDILTPIAGPASNPATVIAPANPRPRPQPTGDVCTDLKNGTLLQSNVPIEAVYACSAAGVQNWGVGISGLSGLGECGDAGTMCAGNPPLGVGISPADRARGEGNGVPWWTWLTAAAGVWALSQSQPKKGGR